MTTESYKTICEDAARYASYVGQEREERLARFIEKYPHGEHREKVLAGLRREVDDSWELFTKLRSLAALIEQCEQLSAREPSYVAPLLHEIAAGFSTAIPPGTGGG
jgi:hypothetical protein